MLIGLSTRMEVIRAQEEILKEVRNRGNDGIQIIGKQKGRQTVKEREPTGRRQERKGTNKSKR